MNVAVETARPLLDAKRHQLHRRRCPPRTVQLEADPLRLSQVIGNLLTNAAKYTDPEGQHRRCSAQLENTELVISITDDGIGLSPRGDPRPVHDVLAGQLRDRSRRGRARHRARAREGTRRAARRTRRGAQRGTGPGQRVHRASAAQGTRAGGRQGVAEHDRRGANASAQAPRRACWSSTTTAMPPSRSGSCSSSRATKSSPRSTAPSALEIGARERPHAALIDIGMPGMSGHEVARRIAARSLGQACRADRAHRLGPGLGQTSRQSRGLRRAPDETRGSRRHRTRARRPVGDAPLDLGAGAPTESASHG